MADPAAEPAPAARGLALTGQPLPVFTEPVSAPHGHTPLRRARSVRRTMSLDVGWPTGIRGPDQYEGRCRDLLTLDPAAPPRVIAEAQLQATAASREIRSLAADPAPARLQELVGVRAGGHLRVALAEVLGHEKARGEPLYLLLDDLAGTTLVGKWAFTRWFSAAELAPLQRLSAPPMSGVCIGLRPGSSALDADGRSSPNPHATRVVALPHPADPIGWHALATVVGPHFRRARCIDVWRDGDGLVAESLFQDSAQARDGGERWAIHEYRLRARIGGDGRLRELEAIPGTLPFPDCRVAYLNNAVLIGTPVRDLREAVLERLKLTAGCTHLNDMLRALAEVPVLAGHLPPG